MAIRNIMIEGKDDDVLRCHCREVGEVTDRIRMILDDMLETMRLHGGVGIAAPQVGIRRRMFIIEPEPGQVTEFIDPVILEVSGTQTGEEGCLSSPGLVGTVDRPEYIKIEATDRNGERFELEGTGFLPVVISHEYDHLDGILYIDKAENIHEAEAEIEEE